MAIEFKVEGLDTIFNKLDELTDVHTLTRAMGKACAVVEASAKKNAPKDTGALRNSITSEVRTEGEQVVGVVYTPLEYAPYVEYGTGLFADNGGRTDVPWCYQDDKGNWHSTSGQKPQPFMYPALLDNRKKVVEIIKESIKND